MDVDDEDDPDVLNQLIGPGQGNIVQAGRIYGDVTFNTAPGESTQTTRLMVTVEEVSKQYRPAGIRRNIRLLVEARGTQAVVLRALRPVIAERPTFPGERYASQMPVRLFSVRFHKDQPVVRARRGLWFRRMAEFPFSVTSLDPELFDLLVDVPCGFALQFELDWTCAGSEGSSVLVYGNDLPYVIGA